MVVLLRWILVSQLLMLPSVIAGLPWRRFHQKKNAPGRGQFPDSSTTHQQRSTSTDTSSASSSLVEPLLQVPCALQLVPNTGDTGMARPQHAVGTCIDTGAQRTCMSWDTVQRLGLAHVMDARYQGRATGLGSCRVLGRIPAHTVQLQFVGPYGSVMVLAPAIVVLESITGGGNDNEQEEALQNVNVLLGLDFLREARAVIDLNDESLHLTTTTTTITTSTTTPGGGNTKKHVVKIPFVSSRHGNNNMPIMANHNDKRNTKATQYAHAKEFVVSELPTYYPGNNNKNNNQDEDNSDSDSEMVEEEEGKMDMRGL